MRILHTPRIPNTWRPDRCFSRHWGWQSLFDLEQIQSSIYVISTTVIASLLSVVILKSCLLQTLQHTNAMLGSHKHHIDALITQNGWIAELHTRGSKTFSTGENVNVSSKHLQISNELIHDRYPKIIILSILLILKFGGYFFFLCLQRNISNSWTKKRLEAKNQTGQGWRSTTTYGNDHNQKAEVARVVLQMGHSITIHINL